MKLTIREFLTDDERSPFAEWLRRLDVGARARIQARVFRFETGNLGDHKSVGEGVLEARLAFGPGYRIYFGREGNQLILLLLGGDKATQEKDIRQARRYWKAYQEALSHGKAK